MQVLGFGAARSSAPASLCDLKFQISTRPYVHRNQPSASTNATVVHASNTPSRPAWADSGAPSRNVERNASYKAVSGSARISGSTTAGNRSYEKNTPENTHIGIITRLISPLTVSIFC